MFHILISIIFIQCYLKAEILMDNEIYSYNTKNNCAFIVIKENTNKNVVLVNFKSDDKLIKDLNTLDKTFVARSFLWTTNTEYNEAYIINVEDFQEFEAGLKNLSKEIFWNPGAIFIVCLKELKDDIPQYFRDLHVNYVFKVIVATTDEIFFYDFNKADHCNFTPGAIVNYTCHSLLLSKTFETEMQSVFKEPKKPPYSQCNMSLIVNIKEPFTFLPANIDSNRAIGYEEEFINILFEKMNFNNLTLIFNNKADTGLRTGLVYKNFSCSGIMNYIDTGVIDGVVGGEVMLSNRMIAFDISYPHLHDDSVVVIRKPTKVKKWLLFIKQFQTSVWIMIFITFISYTVLIFVTKAFGAMNLETLLLDLLISFRYLLGNIYFTNRKKAQYLIILWVVYTWMIGCFYLCNLSSVFTKPVYNIQFKSLIELIHFNYETVFSNSGSKLYASQNNETNSVYSDYKYCRKIVDCLNKVAAKEIKFYITTKQSYQYFESEFHSTTGEPMLYIIKEALKNVYLTGYFKKGNPNLKQIRFIESNIITFNLHKRAMYKYMYTNLIKNKHDDECNDFQPLSCDEISGIYFIYIGGVVISMIILLFEILLNKI